MNATLSPSRLAPEQFTLLDPIDDQILIIQIDAFAASMNKCYPQMSNTAQAQAIRLAHSLSKIRMKFTI